MAEKRDDEAKWAKANQRPTARLDESVPMARDATLRDYFAAQVIGHANIGSYWTAGVGKGYAERAYELADFMIEARNQGNG